MNHDLTDKQAIWDWEFNLLLATLLGTIKADCDEDATCFEFFRYSELNRPGF